MGRHTQGSQTTINRNKNTSFFFFLQSSISFWESNAKKGVIEHKNEKVCTLSPNQNYKYYFTKNCLEIWIFSHFSIANSFFLLRTNLLCLQTSTYRMFPENSSHSYSWFHIKGFWSVHLFNGDYLSNPSAHR